MPFIHYEPGESARANIRQEILADWEVELLENSSIPVLDTLSWSPRVEYTNTNPTYSNDNELSRRIRDRYYANRTPIQYSSSPLQTGAFTVPIQAEVNPFDRFITDSSSVRAITPAISEADAREAVTLWDATRSVASRLVATYVLFGRAGVEGQAAPFGPFSFAFDDQSAQDAGYSDFEAWGEAMVTFRSTFLQPTFAVTGQITAEVRRTLNKALPAKFSVSFAGGKMRFATTRNSALATQFCKDQTIRAKQSDGSQWRNRPFTVREDGTYAPDQIVDMFRISATFADGYAVVIKRQRDALRSASENKLSNQPKHVRNERKRSGDSEQGFTAWLEKRAANSVSGGRAIIANLPAAEHGKASSRKWGIEVESPGARGLDAPQGWRSVGDGSLNSAYDDGYQNGDCQEFVSPILHSFHSKGLEFLTDEMTDRPQNDSAGLHVHVEASDLSAPQLGAIVFGYQIIEPIIKAAYQRSKWQYCNLRTNYDVLRLFKALSADEGADYGTRYTTLNLQSLEEHGTIEFRAMGPVYEYEYLIRWASFCREMVNTAKNGAKAKDYQKVVDEASLRALFIKFGNETVDNALSEMTDEIRSSIQNDNSRVGYELVNATNGEI
jgi:hypothetical protein